MPTLASMAFLRRSANMTWLAVATLLFLAGCQTLPPPERAALAEELVLPVPFIAQERYQCGPAALAMMLQWSGREVDAEELVDEVWLPGRQGSLGMELRASARARGLLPYPVESAEALFTELQHGRPVLVMQNLALPKLPQWHFAVVTGYQNNGRTLVLHSGTREYTTMHWNRFIRTWARADQWGFTLVEPGTLPASATIEGLFKHITPLDNSAEFWPHAVAAFPESGLLWFAYGNSLWEQQQYAPGLRAFRQAVLHSPAFAVAWHNLGHAEAAQGNPDASRKALCKARTLAPTDSQIQTNTEHLECERKL